MNGLQALAVAITLAAGTFALKACFDLQPEAPAPAPAISPAAPSASGPSRLPDFEVKVEGDDMVFLGITPDHQIRFRIRPAYRDHAAVEDCTVYAIMLDSFRDRIAPNPHCNFGTVPAGEAREGEIPIPPGAVRARLRSNGTWAPAP